MWNLVSNGLFGKLVRKWLINNDFIEQNINFFLKVIQNLSIEGRGRRRERQIERQRQRKKEGERDRDREIKKEIERRKDRNGVGGRQELGLY